MELEHDCPTCESTAFYQAASTMVHLGEKVKWRCTECEYTFVRIGGTVDSSVA